MPLIPQIVVLLHAKKLQRIISPMILETPFIQGGTGMGEMLFIPPKSLLNLSRHLSHDTQVA